MELAAWQVIVGLVVILLPLALMADFWGDERVDFRGRPIDRRWEEGTDDR